MTRLYYTTKEVAEMTGLSVRRVQQAAPKLALWCGRIWLWTDEDVRALTERKGKVGRRRKGAE